LEFGEGSEVIRSHSSPLLVSLAGAEAEPGPGRPFCPGLGFGARG